MWVHKVESIKQSALSPSIVFKTYLSIRKFGYPTTLVMHKSTVYYDIIGDFHVISAPDSEKQKIIQWRQNSLNTNGPSTG